MEKRKIIIEKLFPNLKTFPENIEKKYPSRNLKQETLVTRIAPSPTGFLHIGGIYAGLLSERLAHQSNGIFYIRIEDTDKKREIKGATELAIKSFETFGIFADEGETLSGEEKGNYGPYKQSKREEIYKTFAKKLVKEGYAYPCFCTSEELEKINIKQKENEIRTGYYEKWAQCREKSDEEILQALNKNKPFVIRFKSNGNNNNRIEFNDLIKGKLSLPENDQDIVIIKSDGLPTYHFAHVIDDHFMRTTNVLRGDEWLSSISLHLELFKTLNWNPPKYGHFPPINILEGNSKRKLSKRKDPEANVFYYDKEGYPTNAIIEYLLNLIDSSFEEWRKQNPKIDNTKFHINLKHLSASAGPLLDMQKLQDISKNYISQLSTKEIFQQCNEWAKKYDKDLAKRLENDSEYIKKIFSIERDGDKPRKDTAKWSDIKCQIEYFFDDIFKNIKIDLNELLPNIQKIEIEKIAKQFLLIYNEKDNKDEWFLKLKKMAKSLGYADNIKSYKEQTDQYKGHIGDVAMILRVLLTKRKQTPDLFQMIQCMGTARLNSRLKKFNILFI
ncbi:glutamate--tRNA ligase [Candidatus Kuenenbacteria bacterium HGW-Kuenenbacteria-1]|uniref:Glutamate--tRNA ligase n=1 Tax=Candidatus Kuenenbacteria bacterium HGW-Kuenenbacteria-1 TaxID=2013812 RepID=A0A2N1UP39_9BACT|nr:MAG: glutamate--tRNA ligase [Candidatus Kuenenbacteria bacterium HGW-Kuenenbacteria-1]